MRDTITLIRDLRHDLYWDSVEIRSHVRTEAHPHKISEEEFQHYLHEVEQRLFEIQRIIER
jgi:hypothetical protein